MEIKWLEDFISLAETRSFSRSAAQRHVTQPAFSRRIQALEAWLGTELIDRSSYPTQLTSAGDVFYEQALAMLAQVSEARVLMRSQRSGDASMIDVAVPHTLSLTFFPNWLRQVQAEVGRINCRLRALNVHDAVMALTDGGCDLLICYHHPRLPVQLDPARYAVRVLGAERLAPYSRPAASGRPEFRVGGKEGPPVPFLSYTPNAYLGRMVDLVLADAAVRPALDKCYETDMAEGLKAMALAGHGVAFLPESAVRNEVEAGTLVRAESRGDRPLAIDLEIRLYRELPEVASLKNDAAKGRTTPQKYAHRKREKVDQLWEWIRNPDWIS